MNTASFIKKLKAEKRQLKKVLSKLKKEGRHFSSDFVNITALVGEADSLIACAQFRKVYFMTDTSEQLEEAFGLFVGQYDFERNYFEYCGETGYESETFTYTTRTVMQMVRDLEVQSNIDYCADDEEFKKKRISRFQKDMRDLVRNLILASEKEVFDIDMCRGFFYRVMSIVDVIHKEGYNKKYMSVIMDFLDYLQLFTTSINDVEMLKKGS